MWVQRKALEAFGAVGRLLVNQICQPTCLTRSYRPFHTFFPQFRTSHPWPGLLRRSVPRLSDPHGRNSFAKPMIRGFLQTAFRRCCGTTVAPKQSSDDFEAIRNLYATTRKPPKWEQLLSIGHKVRLCSVIGNIIQELGALAVIRLIPGFLV